MTKKHFELLAKALASFRRQDQKSESMDEAQWSLLLDKI